MKTIRLFPILLLALVAGCAHTKPTLQFSVVPREDSWTGRFYVQLGGPSAKPRVWFEVGFENKRMVEAQYAAVMKIDGRTEAYWTTFEVPREVGTILANQISVFHSRWSDGSSTHSVQAWISSVDCRAFRPLDHIPKRDHDELVLLPVPGTDQAALVYEVDIWRESKYDGVCTQFRPNQAPILR